MCADTGDIQRMAPTADLIGMDRHTCIRPSPTHIRFGCLDVGLVKGVTDIGCPVTGKIDHRLDVKKVLDFCPLHML